MNTAEGIHADELLRRIAEDRADGRAGIENRAVRAGDAHAVKAVFEKSAEPFLVLFQGELNLLVGRDIDGHTLGKAESALVVVHDRGRVLDPDNAAVAGKEAVLGLEALSELLAATMRFKHAFA